MTSVHHLYVRRPQYRSVTWLKKAASTRATSGREDRESCIRARFHTAIGGSGTLGNQLDELRRLALADSTVVIVVSSQLVPTRSSYSHQLDLEAFELSLPRLHQRSLGLEQSECGFDLNFPELFGLL